MGIRVLPGPLSGYGVGPAYTVVHRKGSANESEGREGERQIFRDRQRVWDRERETERKRGVVPRQ